MFINGVYYKATDSILEIIINKFLYKRKIYKFGNQVVIEKI